MTKIESNPNRTTFAKASVTLDHARALIEAAEHRAAELGIAVAVAVCDESGVLKAFSRMDAAHLSAVGVAQEKAYTAAAAQIPTSAWFAAAQSSPEFAFAAATLPRALPLAGGQPILVAGQVVGAIGVSGGYPDQDEAIATSAPGTTSKES